MTNLESNKAAPWREAVVTFDVLAGSVMAAVAAWAWLVCEVQGAGACGCLLWMIPAGALLAASGAMLGDGTTVACRLAVGCKVAAALLIGVVAAAHFSHAGTIGLPGLGVAALLGEAALTARG